MSLLLQSEFSQEDEDTNVHEDDLSLSISDLHLECHSEDSLTTDLISSGCKAELDLDSCALRYTFLLQFRQITVK